LVVVDGTHQCTNRLGLGNRWKVDHCSWRHCSGKIASRVTICSPSCNGVAKHATTILQRSACRLIGSASCDSPQH
jgi:hypothetical protein